jgi:hypothetical protein
MKQEVILSIVIKTIGKQQYAYQAYRNGNRIVQKYLGNIADNKVKKMLEELKRTNQVQQRFYPLFWDVEPNKINIRKNARYIIERVLEVGDTAAFQWIQNMYPTRLILDTCNTSRKISEKSRTFWKIWLGEMPNAQ